MATKIQVRRGTASGWTTANTVLDSGELGFETDTGLFKIGNGSTAWDELGYAGGEWKPGAAELVALNDVDVSGGLNDGDLLLYDDAAGEWKPGAAGFRYAGTRYYTSSGTFAKADPFGTGDIGLRAVRVRMVGGGGGVGNLTATSSSGATVSSGGGGGGYCEKFYGPSDVAGFAASITVTTGSGGAGGVAGASGSVGGASSFLGMTANGGNRGQSEVWTRNTSSPYATNGSLGGSASGGDLNITGGRGGVGVIRAPCSSCGNGGEGGGSQLGPTMEGRRTTGITNGALYGGGAGGNFLRYNESAADGGSGAAGIVIIDCYV